ncbi:MAG: cell division protein FtsA [Candidatus Taylorbacteria bacterium CG10_big_fil_rev_8_21_14_0_10_41_48]|uniref:Cell division protein FtsA n=1 Tax=Candidatus Taylorbacteria bacterium CG10_big_fil_rev_8_21_14_0_10_41_48 TaxID=1975024 RepID=A0A2M8LBH8_9BACT|nr:MAG: cell division protein FtsA [Candidatus Taylorbacteria bacterium CG10_big_fil_rev_8_21_14_0_10_41_48]
MRKHIAVGIDIGTYQVKVVVAERDPRSTAGTLHVIGAGVAESRGLRHGYVVNSRDTSKSIALAIAQAERSAKVKIKKAYVSIGGVGLQSTTSTGTTIISRGDSTVSDLDMDKAISAAERDLSNTYTLNQKIIHPIPLSWKIDGKEVLGRPQGMKGKKLEGKVLFVTCLTQHLDDLVEAVGDAGVEVQDIIASPIAASLVTLSKSQKIAGCVLANIGGETLSMVVYENNLPISLEVFPIGSTDITNDIALGMRLPIEEAENIKRGSTSDSSVSKKKLDEIVVARLKDMFELIEAHLKKINKNGLLPAGIIITGGGSGLATIEDLAKATLRLPSRIGKLGLSDGNDVKDATWSVAYGLCLLGLGSESDDSGLRKTSAASANRILSFLKQFLP